MTATAPSPVDALIEAAKCLTRDEQVDFFDRFAEVLGDHEDDDQPMSPEWMTEIDRRVAEVEAGTCELHDWDDVLKEARQSLKRPG